MAILLAIAPYLAFAFSLLAALFWLKSSLIKLPPTGEEPWKGTGPFHAALVKQSRWNAGGAVCAAAAALVHAVSLIPPN